MYLIFDTETTGLPKNWKAPITDTDNWPRWVQIAWQLHDEMGELIEDQNYLIKPDNFEIPYESQKIHGISTELALEAGKTLNEVLEKFNQSLEKSSFVIGHNVNFDINVIGCEFYRKQLKNGLSSKKLLDTCTEDTALLCELPGGRGGKYKLPTLIELYKFLFESSFKEAHNATADVEATARCFLELVRNKQFSEDQLGVTSDYFEKYIRKNSAVFEKAGIKHVNLKKKSEKLKQSNEKEIDEPVHTEKQISSDLDDVKFVHLHNHTQFSVLQSTMSIVDLVSITSKMNMPAVALTDNANMMGAFRFVNEIQKYNQSIDKQEEDVNDKKQKIKPIVGCVFYVCEDHLNKNHRDNGYQIVFLAKNKNGYNNLSKLSSIAYTKGFYYVPRIDRSLVEEYKDDLIVLSGNLMGEISNKILNIGQKSAEEALLWWKKIFKDDFYIEIMRHNQEDEDLVNNVLVEFSKKHNIKIVATNNNFYKEKSEADAHDILLCIKEGEKLSTPVGRGRGFRYGLPNQQYYYKSDEQMKELFYDLPDAINNISEIVDKIEGYTLSNQVLLPKFDIPSDFIDKKDEKDGGKRGENNYLKHFTYLGAKKRYGEISSELEERIEFELNTIKNTGYPGYF